MTQATPNEGRLWKTWVQLLVDDVELLDEAGLLDDPPSLPDDEPVELLDESLFDPLPDDEVLVDDVGDPELDFPSLRLSVL